MLDSQKPVQTTVPVGKLPSQYQGVAGSSKLYLIIPALICLSLLWFAWSQFHHPLQIQNRQTKIENPTAKKRVWWMPDLLKTLPPFADGYRVEKYLPKYNLTGCTISGNFPELTSAIFCFLSDSEKFQNTNRSISRDFNDNGLCENTPPFSLSTWEDWKKYLKKATRRITVVQQPLERFARSFRKICVQDQKCYDCKDNVACFMRKLLKDHEKLAEGLEGTVRTFLTDNFSPQTWNCHLHRDLHNVKILKLGGNGPEKLEFARNLNVVLNEQGVPPELQKIVEKEVMKIPLKLSDEEKKIMETVKRDEDLWRLFRYLYEHDFTVFGYKL